MSNNKQSSVEWLDDKLAILNFDYLTGQIGNKEYNERHKQILEQAKAMHKEEQIDSLINGMYKGQEMYFSEHKVKLDDNSTVFCAAIAEQYYNTTFGGNDEQQ